MFVIDRSLNYGRPLIRKFLSSVGDYKAAADLGAGTGVDLQIARDVNPAAVLHAIEVHKPYADNLRSMGHIVHSINIEHDRFPFADESMDVLMANQVLEHIKEVFWIFHEVSRSLKVGGHFIVGVPNLASLHNRVLLGLGRQPTAIQVNSAHVRGYTKQGLMRFIDDAAPGVYRLKASGGSNFYPFPPFIAKPLAALFPNMAWGCFLLLEKVKKYDKEFLDYIAPGKLETNFYSGL
jgi:SAM-dependent methyltransferase